VNVVSRSTDTARGGSQHSNFTPSAYRPERCSCPGTVCNYKCLNILSFPNGAFVYAVICYESAWIPACWRWSISPSCSI